MEKSMMNLTGRVNNASENAHPSISGVRFNEYNEVFS